MNLPQTLASLALSTLLAGTALAQAPAVAIKVEGAWARASVPGQKGSGAFMKLTAPQGARLVGASSPAAGVAEVHEMKLDGDVMRMRAVPVLDLPAGQPVELKPGGYHVMLLDLKAPLVKDGTVPLTLTFKDGKGVESKLDLTLPVAISAPGGQPGAAAHMGGHKH